jgi:hypothetical protein
MGPLTGESNGISQKNAILLRFNCDFVYPSSFIR